MKKSFTKPGLILLFSIVFIAGAGTAYAGVTLPTITLGGNVDIIGDLICIDCVDHSNILQIGSQDTIGKISTNGSGDCLLGEIKLFSNILIPRGFLPTEGQILSIAQNDALFSLLGTKYGGNGVTTFGLPDLRNVEPTHRTGEGIEVDTNYAICVSGTFPPSD